MAFRAYGADDEGWIPLGRTPLPAGTRVPHAQLRWRISKEGFDTLEASPNQAPLSFTLVPSGTAPARMVRVGAGSFRLESARRDVALPDFWIDRFEVTNRQFKEFIARGGYTTRAWWRSPSSRTGAACRGRRRCSSSAIRPAGPGRRHGSSATIRTARTTFP